MNRPTRHSHLHYAHHRYNRSRSRSCSQLCSMSPYVNSWDGIRPIRHSASPRERYSPMPLERDSIVGDTLKPIEALPATRGGHLPRVDELLKGPENYTDWCNLIKWLFITYKVEHYCKDGQCCGCKPRPAAYTPLSVVPPTCESCVYTERYPSHVVGC